MKKCLKRTKNTKNHKYTKNHNHMTCRSSDRVRTSLLPILDHFYFFTPFLTQKIKFFEKWKKKQPNKQNKKNPGYRYSGLSLSRLLSISNFSPFRTKSSVPWTFVCSLRYFYLFISNFYILIFFSISNKNICPLLLFLSLSRTFSRLRVHLQSK